MLFDSWKNSSRTKELTEDAVRRCSPRKSNSESQDEIQRRKAAGVYEKPDLACLSAQVEHVDNLESLKSKARFSRNGEFQGQRHWFSEARVTNIQTLNTAASPSLPSVDRQSRLDAILDLMTLGSTHYSSGR